MNAASWIPAVASGVKAMATSTECCGFCGVPSCLSYRVKLMEPPAPVAAAVPVVWSATITWKSRSA